MNHILNIGIKQYKRLICGQGFAMSTTTHPVQRFQMSSLDVWYAGCFIGWVANWRVRPLCPLFTIVKELKKRCANYELGYMFSKMIGRNG